MRKAIFWLHLAAGLFAGGVVLVLAATGLMIAFEKQLVSLADRGIYTVAPAAAPLAPEALLARASAALPDARPIAITLRSDPAAPATVTFAGDRTLFIDPGTGAVLGGGSWLRGFLRDVEHFHRDLALGETGKRITGAASLAFLVLVASGLWLWFPRRLVKAIVRPRLGLRGKARDFNWHNAVGFWAALPLAVIIATGIVINYEWATRLLFRAAGSEPPPARKAGNKPAGGPPGGADFTRLDEIIALAQSHSADWKVISLRAQNPNAPASVMVDRSDGSRPDLRAMLSADLRTGRITKTEGYESNPRGRQWRMWMVPLHTGRAAGLAGQVVAALAALSALVLVWTGFALSWRRFFSRRRRDAEPAPAT